MGRVQLVILMLAVALFMLLSMTDGNAAFTVQEYVPGWISL